MSWDGNSCQHLSTKQLWGFIFTCGGVQLDVYSTFEMYPFFGRISPKHQPNWDAHPSSPIPKTLWSTSYSFELQCVIIQLTSRIIPIVIHLAWPPYTGSTVSSRPNDRALGADLFPRAQAALLSKRPKMRSWPWRWMRASWATGPWITPGMHSLVQMRDLPSWKMAPCVENDDEVSETWGYKKIWSQLKMGVIPCSSHALQVMTGHCSIRKCGKYPNFDSVHLQY